MAPSRVMEHRHSECEAFPWLGRMFTEENVISLCLPRVAVAPLSVMAVQGILKHSLSIIGKPIPHKIFLRQRGVLQNILQQNIL